MKVTICDRCGERIRENAMYPFRVTARYSDTDRVQVLDLCPKCAETVKKALYNDNFCSKMSESEKEA